METLDRNVLVLIVGRAGLPHFGQKIAEVHIKRPLLPFSDQECEKITKISFDLLTSSSSLMSRMPNVTNITIHCQNPFEQLELLGETVKAIKSESVVYFDVQSSYRLGLFQKGESIAQDESWDRYEVTAPLKPILRDFVLKQKTPVLHFHGFFEPCYILRTAEDQILGYCWINYCDGFPGWTRGLFAATALFFNGYTFIADKVLDGNDGETIEQCVMRWDKIDDEGVYLENCCFTDSRKKGDGLGLGNGHFWPEHGSFSVRPMGLFSDSNEYRYEAGKTLRHQQFLKE